MPLTIEISPLQQSWIEVIEGYENWRMDNTPNRFVTLKEGNIFWFKSNGKQRIRVSEKYVSFYNKPDGEELADTWSLQDSPEELMNKYLGPMLKQTLKYRDLRERGLK